MREREYGLDWLRVFAFAVLIFYHSGMGYVSWGWHVKNPEKLQWLEYVMLACNRWRLPLLFFISGAGVCFSLRRRAFPTFVRDRLQRLLLPLLMGMFVIVPPQIYFERLHRGATFSYAEFYPSVFEFVPYPQGSFSWHHLWFLAYVGTFSLIGIPLFAWLRSEAGVQAIAALSRFFGRYRIAIYLANIPNLAVGLTLGPHWPTTHNLVADWANFTGTLITFLWGYVIASNRDLLDLITRRRREFAVLGVVIAVVFFTARASGVRGSLFWELVNGYYGMTWVFALIGYARTYANKPNRALAWATEAVYPFYIFHQTITVAAVFWLIPVQMPVWAKLVVAALTTFFGSLALFLLARLTGPLRPFFGLKPHDHTLPAAAPVHRA